VKTPTEAPIYIGSAQLPILGTSWAAANHAGLVAFEFGIPEDEFLNGLFPEGIPTYLNTSSGDFSQQLTSLALKQVDEYLNGARQQFTLPIDWRPFTAFQAEVYRAVIEIPFGRTSTYGQIAAQINRPLAARAVGAANAANPLPIIIPCHRLVGKDGSLRGYGGKGGIRTKQWLLAHERHFG